MHESEIPIVKTALAHLQFEISHPFLDGDGRVGRLLIVLMFCLDNVLRNFTEAIRHSAEVAIETGGRATRVFSGQFLASRSGGAGIAKESTGRARDRVYAYRRYLEVLAAEEEAH